MDFFVLIKNNSFNQKYFHQTYRIYKINVIIMRPCPFCNFDEGYTHETSYKKPITYKVICNVCGSSGPEAKTRKMAEQKWDGLLLDVDLDEVEELLDEDMGGVSAPAATLSNTPGVGNATPATIAATSGAQQTSSSAIGSGDKWGDGLMYDQNGKIKKKKKKKSKLVKEYLYGEN